MNSALRNRIKHAKKNTQKGKELRESTKLLRSKKGNKFGVKAKLLKPKK